MARTPKAKSVRVPGYCYHKATGQAYSTIGGTVVYWGKHKLKPDGSPDCPAYHQRIAEWLQDRQQAAPAPSATAEAPITVVELAALYWAHAEGFYRKQDGSGTGELPAIKAALKPLVKMFPELLARDFGPLKLAAVRDYMVGPLGWARSNVNRQVSRLRQCFRWGESQEKLPKGHYHGLQTLQSLPYKPHKYRESERVPPVPVAALDATLGIAPPMLAAMIQVQLLTGMRPGEMLIMRPCDIRMENKDGREFWTYKPSHHKNSHKQKDRLIPIGPKVRAIIRPILPSKLDGYIFHPAEGDRFDVAGYRRAIARVCDKAFPLTSELAADWKAVQTWVFKWAYDHDGKMPKLEAYPREIRDKRDRVEAFRAANRWHPHQLRHSAGTAIGNKFGGEGAQEMLGHADIKTTLRYWEKDIEKSRAIAEQVG